MTFDPDLQAFIEAAKEIKQKQILQDLSTEDLQKLHYEIAEDPAIMEAIKNLI